MSHGEESQVDTPDPASDETRLGNEPTAEPIEEPQVRSRGDWEKTEDIDAREIESMFEERAEFPSLVIISGARAGEMRRLEADRTVLGRKRADVDLWFRDPAVSRIHAEILHRDDGTVLLQDLDSSNGTFIDGEKIDGPTELSEGDKITLGSSVLIKFTRQDALDEEFQRRMYNSTIRDELTGAYSRSYLLEQMRSEMAFAERHDVELTLVFLDIDRFKAINDAYGHLAGDDCLVQLADMIRSEIRQEDLFARYGGEEFAILVRGVALADVEEMAERIRARVDAETFDGDGESLSMTVSVGLAPFESEAMEGADDWIRAADEAMYLAKEDGRNCVRLHRAAHDFDGGTHETLQ